MFICLADDTAHAQALAAAEDEASLQACCTPVARGLGFDWLDFQISDPYATGSTPRLHVGSFPPSWSQRYATHGYERVDPVLRRARLVERPVFWSSVPTHHPLERLFMSAAASHGLVHGVTFCLRQRDGSLATLSLAGRDDPLRNGMDVETLALRLRAFLLVLCEAATRLLQRQRTAVLSDADRDVLALAALGLDNRAIGRCLERGPRAVATHLAAAAARLGTRGRHRAAQRAIRAGLLDVERHLEQRGLLLRLEPQPVLQGGLFDPPGAHPPLHEFWLAYQPIVYFESQRTEAFEALLRRDHPVTGPMSPGEFIPLLEQDGGIIPVGAWVIASALRELAGWRQPDRRLRVSVNLSTRQLTQAGLVRHIARELERNAVDAADLILEITETAPMDLAGQSARTLAELAEMGVQILLDDYGAGYAPLPSIALPHVQGIKLDSGLIGEIDHSPRMATLVRGTIRMARDMGLLVVAEGVETTAQLEMVREFGAHAVQGFYFSRGVHASECLAAAQRCSERLVRVTAASLPTPCLPPRRRLGRVSAAATR